MRDSLKDIPGATIVADISPLTVDEVVAFAETLRPAHAGEIEELLKHYGSSVPLGPLAEGETVVARGEVDGVRWRLVAADDVAGQAQPVRTWFLAGLAAGLGGTTLVFGSAGLALIGSTLWVRRISLDA